MTRFIRALAVALFLGFTTMVALFPSPATAASRTEIDRDVDAALQQLYESTPLAKQLASEAKAILVFPCVV
jgi:hypothetical protein